ncbi:MAG: hypothetical protein WD382_01115 [Halofilum sp. (in: g-proteobacteria)]
MRCACPHEGHAFYKIYAFARPEPLAGGWDRDRIVREAQEQGVPCMQGICPEIYRERAFAGSGLAPERRLSVAQQLGETSIMVPVHPTLDADEVHRMGEALVAVARRAVA